MHLKYRLRNGGHFVKGGELIEIQNLINESSALEWNDVILPQLHESDGHVLTFILFVSMYLPDFRVVICVYDVIYVW